MKKVAIVTATRAEYGILTPLIRAIAVNSKFELNLIVTGTHLSEKFGNTQSFIEADGFKINHKIPIIEADNSPYDISVTMANALKGFAECFANDRPDLLIILGDRPEMLGVAASAMNERIPIAHLHGGEVTEGAVDDCVRHALTKMSYLHFTATESYRKRIIQLGEDPERVFNVGALSTENILHTPLLSRMDICNDIGILCDMPYSIVTFHPVTLEVELARSQTIKLCGAMAQREDIFYLITMANSDAGGDEVNRIMREFARNHENISFVCSLGMKRYLSAVKYASFVLGNSSSGLIEAPVLGTPTVNIGDRQRGRIMAECVINCESETQSILRAIDLAMQMTHKASFLFGDGNTSSTIVKVIEDYLFNDKIKLKKKFYNLR